ncbi:MAG: hypothetical protein GQ549_05865, partial [Gammaproteobacteria bacterium]|nr:hypothetical protein [Gammaproteobacteria bacterium]
MNRILQSGNIRLTDIILKLLTFKFLILLFIVALSACDTRPVKPEQIPAEKIKPATEKQVTLSEEAERLLELAEDSDTEAEQFKYRALAAHLYIEASEIQLAQAQLELLREKNSNRPATDETSANIETAEILLISAEIAIHKKNALLADQIINEIKAITRKQQINFFSLKADLDFLSTSYMHAVDRRVQLAAYITDSKAREQNNRKIWAALSSLSNTQLKNQRSNNATINGWLDLAKVMRAGQQNISKLEDDLLNWGTRHPAHPVNDDFLPELISIYQLDVSHKKQIAVLLPMSGDLSNITANIKNGLLSAYYNDANTAIKPEIHFYDSSDKNLTFNELYEQASADGATNIIGPLDKIVINQLAQRQELDIPVLTLNYAENEFSNTRNLFQFG